MTGDEKLVHYDNPRRKKSLGNHFLRIKPQILGKNGGSKVVYLIHGREVVSFYRVASLTAYTMLQNYQEMKVNMSLKIHILHPQLNFFPENLGAVSVEHGKRFPQDIGEIEKS